MKEHEHVIDAMLLNTYKQENLKIGEKESLIFLVLKLHKNTPKYLKEFISFVNKFDYKLSPVYQNLTTLINSTFYVLPTEEASHLKKSNY